MIEPTQEYKNIPAMQSEGVAELIYQTILSRRRTYTPWWLTMGQLVFALFRWSWEIIISKRLEPKQ